MIMNRSKQRGATLISWMILAGFGMFLASAVVKLVPYYVEFNSIKTLMTNIAGERGIKGMGKRDITLKVGKYLNVNGINTLDRAYKSRATSTGRKSKDPFTIKKIKKGKFKGKRILSVNYTVPQPWVGNLSFLLTFNHAVILGEPETAVKLKQKKFSGYKKMNLDFNGH